MCKLDTDLMMSSGVQKNPDVKDHAAFDFFFLQDGVCQLCFFGIRGRCGILYNIRSVCAGIFHQIIC